ncbi:MAG: hypothetical protein R2852_02500 [Bacteroidia bacterium]
MRFGIYILLGAAFLWFVFGSVFMYRSTWNLSHSKYQKGVVSEMGPMHRENSDKPNIFIIKLQGQTETFGIYRRRDVFYNDLSKNIQMGDTLSIYYENWKQKLGDINFQITNLESNGKTIIDYTKRKKRDVIIAIVLYFICGIFLVIAWLQRQKELRKHNAYLLYKYSIGMQI